MTPPKYIKQVCVFVCLVNYYRYMWSKRSHLLQPLTALASTKLELKWTDVEQKSSDKIKWIFSRDTLLIYTDFNKLFDIHTDASKFQLKVVIIQNVKPITFYSHKLTEAQSRYTVAENELLTIAKTLKEFFTILLGLRLKYILTIKIDVQKL